MRRFGVGLRRARVEKGLTLKQLAAQTGISHGQLWNIEHGESLPSLPAYWALEKVVDL